MECVQRKTKLYTKLHKSQNSNKEEKERALKAVIHSNRDRMKLHFNSMIDRSSPSKVLLFCSLHIVHIIQCRIAPQIEAAECHRNPPCQQASNSTTRLGITQGTPPSWTQTTINYKHKNNEKVGDLPIPHHSYTYNICWQDKYSSSLNYLVWGSFP